MVPYGLEHLVRIDRNHRHRQFLAVILHGGFAGQSGHKPERRIKRKYRVWNLRFDPAVEFVEPGNHDDDTPLGAPGSHEGGREWLAFTPQAGIGSGDQLAFLVQWQATLGIRWNKGPDSLAGLVHSIHVLDNRQG